MGLYEFKAEDAYSFARDRGMQTKRVGDELRFRYCPYCHGGNGQRKDPDTFAINLNTGMFNCKRSTCDAHGNMITLSKDFDFSLGVEVDEYYKGLRKFRDISKHKKADTRPAAVRYMESRGISQDVTEKYNITTQSENENIIVFPFYDENGILQFVKYRNSAFRKGIDKNKEWCEANCKPILFGMNHCNAENKTLIMTEGQIDSLSLSEVGIQNAVSVPTGAKGFTWVPYCWDFLCRFDTLIIFGDCENNHITLLDEVQKRFNGTVKHVRQEDYCGCKDANEILQQYGKHAVCNAVQNAVPVENPKIKRLSEVERVDVSKLAHFSTGIDDLDRILGGFYFGQLVLLTGERGQGKSTLASQFGTFAMKAGYPVFFYSGELMDWMFRDWLDRQIAGRMHINPIVAQNGYTDYSIDANSAIKIAEWYNDLAYIYNNNFTENETEEIQTLPQVLESAIKQYGCRVIVVDNLMTAMQDDTKSDLYRQQSNFVKQLALMAKRFDVLILLIAHPRKQTQSDFGNDDVAGSSNITNLVDVVVRYGMPTDEEDNCSRILTVHKNRLNGKLTGKKGIKLYFDEASKRISPYRDLFGWELGWECTGTEKENQSEEFPF